MGVQGGDALTVVLKGVKRPQKSSIPGASAVKWVHNKLGCSNLRMLVVISIVTTKKIATEHTQEEIRKEFKGFSCPPPPKKIKHRRGE